MKTYKVIKIKGATAYERGVQYGQQAKTEIDIAVAFYKKKYQCQFQSELYLYHFIRCCSRIAQTATKRDRCSFVGKHLSLFSQFLHSSV